MFGEGTSKLANDLSLKILGSIPLNTEISDSTDNGRPIVVEKPGSDISKCYENIAKNVHDFCEK